MIIKATAMKSRQKRKKYLAFQTMIPVKIQGKNVEVGR